MVAWSTGCSDLNCSVPGAGSCKGSQLATGAQIQDGAAKMENSAGGEVEAGGRPRRAADSRAIGGFSPDALSERSVDFAPLRGDVFEVWDLESPEQPSDLEGDLEASCSRAGEAAKLPRLGPQPTGERSTTLRSGPSLGFALFGSRSFGKEPPAAALRPTLPLRLQGLSASASRDISMAARVHTGATVALVLPLGLPRPSEQQLSKHGLCHPPDLRGWYPLTDGSALGLLRVVAPASHGRDDWVGHGQAKALRRAQLQIMKLLELYIKVPHHQAELRNSPQSDYQHVLDKVLPGVRMWPLNDVLVSRVLAMNVARQRCSSACHLVRLDRGLRFLDLVRLHYGEEVAFLFAWQSHYIYTLAAFVALTVPFIVARTMHGKAYIDRSILPHSVVTILFGVAVTSLWTHHVKHLVHRWHAHGDCTTRWHHLVLGVLETASKSSSTWDGYVTKSALAADAANRSEGEAVGGLSMINTYTNRMATLERSALQACRNTFGLNDARTWTWCDRLQRMLKASIIIPIVLLEWTIILVFFTGIVWFEIWVIFDWGGCSDYNIRTGKEWGCLSADQLRGLPGIAMGALPSICEGVFFELLLQISRLTAQALVSQYRFRTREQRNFAVVMIIFMLEVVGKVGFISVLGLGFVPAWGSGRATDCRENWDYFIMGDWSLGCLKGKIPFEVRLRLLESAMKGPMLVSGFIAIGLKTVLPMVLELWRRSLFFGASRNRVCTCRCRYRRSVRCLLAPTDLVLKALMLIFQADGRAVGGIRFIWEWPAHIAEDQEGSCGTGVKRMCGFGSDDLDGPPKEGLCPQAAAAATWSEEVALQRVVAKRGRLQDILFEGERREHEPFDEYIELLLHFLWTSCFAVVWPLGCIFSLVNQLLEFRFDCMKMLVVRRRRFPSTRHMSVAWVPRCALIVSHISILVNVALLLLPYKQLLVWYPEACAERWSVHVDPNARPSSCRLPRIGFAFLGTWTTFLIIRFIAQVLLNRFVERSACLLGFALRVLAKAGGPELEDPFAPAGSRRPSGGTTPSTGLTVDFVAASPTSVDSLGMRRGCTNPMIQVFMGGT